MRDTAGEEITMAIIDGTDWDDDLFGFDTHDDIYGYGGDDVIYGYGGDDDIYGGSHNDWIAGGYGADRLFGQSGHDDLYGQAGQDDLYGGSGHDDLYGGSGNDWLIGGTGSDYLAGGSGSDRFFFSRGTSGLSTQTADVIADWNGAYDVVDMTIRGTFTNYRETSTTATSVGAAAAVADWWYSDADVNHVFLYNSDLDRGFLISDLNNDGVFETGVVLKKAGYASDFSYLDIL